MIISFAVFSLLKSYEEVLKRQNKANNTLQDL